MMPDASSDETELPEGGGMNATSRCCIAAFVALAVFASVAGAQNNQPTQKKVLTLAMAKEIMAATEKAACNIKCQGAIAIVDEAGNVILSERMDDTQVPSLDLAIKKARTAALYQRPTKLFEERLAKGETYYLSFPDMLPLIGGAPLVVDGQVIGGIGESGYVQPGPEPNMAGIIVEAGVQALAKMIAH